MKTKITLSIVAILLAITGLVAQNLEPVSTLEAAQLETADMISSEKFLTAAAPEEMEEPRPLIDEVRIFPAPNNGNFTLLFGYERALPLRVRLIDLVGKTHFDDDGIEFNGNYQRTFFFNGIREGVYLIVIDQGTEQVVRKMTVRA